MTSCRPLMIDISEYGFQFRGYPVTIVSEGVMAVISDSDHGVEPELAWILQSAKDWATLSAGRGGPAMTDCPSGWFFESFISPPPEGGTIVLISRFDQDGYPLSYERWVDRHPGGQWAIYLPSEC